MRTFPILVLLLETLKESEAKVIALQEVLVVGKSNYADVVAGQLGFKAAHSTPYDYETGRWVLSILSAQPILGFGLS